MQNVEPRTIKIPDAPNDRLWESLQELMKIDDRKPHNWFVHQFRLIVEQRKNELPADLKAALNKGNSIKSK